MAYTAGTAYEVDPISRIEGHLGVQATPNSSGLVQDAKVHGNLWRGFENFLLGREINDAITFTQRICGVCPVPHGMTSTFAADSVLGYSAGHITFADSATVPTDTYGVPEKAVLIRNMVLMAENMMSSITHFYHLVAPSYIQGPGMPPWTPYFSDSYYNPLMVNTDDAAVPRRATDGTYSDDLWSAVILSYVKALRVRRLTFEAGALFAGRMPMVSCYVGGGVSNDGTEDLTDKCDKFRAIFSEIGTFVITDYVPIALALGILYPNFDNTANATLASAVVPYHEPWGATGNLWDAIGNTAAPGPTNTTYGAGCKRFLAWGAYPGVDASGTLGNPGGLFDEATPANNFTVTDKQDVYDYFLAASGTGSVAANLTEDITNSRYDVATGFDSDAYASGVGGATAAYPGDVARTMPNRGKSGAYTYMKAPRWNGMPCEVGPLARMIVKDLYDSSNGSGIVGKLDAKLSGIASAVYVKSYSTGTAPASGYPVVGLNPQSVSADLAVALVRTGLASLYSEAVASGGASYGLQATDTAPPTDAATLTAAYTHESAVITGWIVTWITTVAAGYSTMDRLRGRAVESLINVVQLLGAPTTVDGAWAFVGTGDNGGFCGQLADRTGSAALDIVGSTWTPKAIPVGESVGYGATEAPRGALAHFATIDAGKITKYQCVVPTTWNGSPAVGTVTNDTVTNRGAIEAACIGVPFEDYGASFDPVDGGAAQSTEGGVEMLRVAQSFDPCIACAIH